MRDKDKYILTVDTGLTGCKALIYDTGGNVLAEAQSTTPVESDGDGSSVIEMNELWQVACQVISRAIKSIGDEGEVVCIGFSGHGNGLYCIDAEGNPVGKAVSSMDSRAEVEVASVSPEGVEYIRKRSMQQLWPGQPSMILRMIKKTAPVKYQKIHRIMFCKDYLSFRLTGKVATDYSDISASGLMDNTTGGYNQELFERMGIPEMFGTLPECIRGYDLRGTVSARGAADTGLPTGIPVIGGMFDVDACAYGCGTIAPESVCCIAGTWNINCMVAEEMRYSNRIRQCVRRTDGRTSLMIDSSATSAVNIKWYMEKLLKVDRRDYDRFDRDMSDHIFSSGSPYFIPFVNGSLNTNAIKAAFAGIDITCGPDTLFAAVYEGICFAHRWHLENLACPETGHSLRLTGGAAKGEQFCRLFANVTGMRVETVNVEQSGAFGIWAAAACALGLYEDMAAATGGKLAVTNNFIPDKSKHELFNYRYGKFKELIKCHL